MGQQLLSSEVFFVRSLMTYFLYFCIIIAKFLLYLILASEHIMLWVEE
jgi:hypothetical protein